MRRATGLTNKRKREFRKALDWALIELGLNDWRVQVEEAPL